MSTSPSITPTEPSASETVLPLAPLRPTTAATLPSETPAAAVLPRSPGWMRSATFDVHFIGTIMLASLAAGIAGLFEARLFAVVLVLDLWLLGYHHVISTFTRLAFDSESFRQHRFLVIQLPIIVIAATLAAVLGLGLWVLPTSYLYWQWFHYTRQSYGIERIYRRRADHQRAIHDYLTTRSLYLLPLFGILYRSYQGQAEFLGMQVRYLSVPRGVLWVVGALAFVSIAAWAVQQVKAYAERRLALPHTLYVLSHHVIFLTGYVLIDNITVGWLVLNVWHNAQYILLVWLYNNNRFKHGIDSRHRFLSTISQTRNVVMYFGVCLGLSTVVYFLLSRLADGLYVTSAVPATLVVFMMINFHHYIVDGIIWKVRKPALQRNLGITG